MNVLIAAPIAGVKQYSINLWLEWIATQSFDNFEICLCTNGKDKTELRNKLEQITIEYPEGRTAYIKVLNLPHSDHLSVIQNITYSREMIRRYAVEKQFDYIFFLDTDTIPAHHDTIDKLISCKKDCVSGLYFYKNTKQPVIIDKDTHTNIRLDKCKEAVDKQELIEVWGFGFGCLLLSRKAFEKNAFDYDLFGEERTDDFGYCHVLEQAGIKRWLDPYILCKHLVDPSLKPTETGTRIPFTIKQS